MGQGVEVTIKLFRGSSVFQMNGYVIYCSRAEDTDPSSSAVSFVPMFHLTGLVVFGSVRHAMGCSLVFMQRFDFEEYLRLVEKYKVHINQKL